MTCENLSLQYRTQKTQLQNLASMVRANDGFGPIENPGEGARRATFVEAQRFHIGASLVLANHGSGPLRIPIPTKSLVGGI